MKAVTMGMDRSGLLLGILLVGFSSVAGPTVKVKGLSVSVQQGNVLRILAQEPGIQVVLYSLAGQKIAEGQSLSNQLRLALPSQLANGVYLYVATTNQGGRMYQVVGKIVVLRGRTFVPRPDLEPRPKKPGVISVQEAAKPVQGPKISVEDAQAAVSYWTEERMRAAKPLDIVLPGGPSEPDDIEPLLSSLEKGQAEKIEGEVPTVFLNEEDRLLNQPGAKAGLTPLNHWSGPPWPYNRFRMPLNPHTLYPARTIGKLFFTIPGQGDFVCSASVVTSANTIKRLVWTAGHCVVSPVSSGSLWHTNVVFVPAYQNGSAPLGVWAAQQLWSLVGWGVQGSLRYDMGAIVTALNNGQRIGNVTGTLGFIWNAQYQQDYHVIVYPKDPPFNGELLISSV